MNSGLYLELNPFSIMDLFSFITALVLAVLFVSRKSENQKANVYLALALMSLALEVLDVLSLSIYPIEIRFIQTSLFTIPFLFFYIYQSTNQPLKWTHYLLFLPGLLINTLLLFFDGEIECRWIEYGFNITLLIFIWKKLKNHREELQQFYSDLEYKTLKWMMLIVYVFLGFHALWIMEDIIGVQNEIIPDYFALLSSLLTFIMIFWMGHFGFSQQESFKKKLFQETKLKQEKPMADSIIENKDEEVFKQICAEILEQRIFTNPKLNLRSLAEELELNEKELSRIINQQSELNFYRFINQFRVDEFKKLLHSPQSQKLSIIGMAEEAGFNSKSTFYTAFKSVEGITPKEYGLQHKVSK